MSICNEIVLFEHFVVQVYNYIDIKNSQNIYTSVQEQGGMDTSIILCGWFPVIITAFRLFSHCKYLVMVYYFLKVPGSANQPRHLMSTL